MSKFSSFFSDSQESKRGISLNIAGIFFKIASCLFFSILNLIKKQTPGDGLILLTLEYSVAGAFFLPLFFFRLPWHLLYNPLFWIRNIFSVLGGVFWIYSLRNQTLLYTLFMGFIGPSITLWLAHIWLKERLNPNQIFALSLSVLGSIILGYAQFVVRALPPQYPIGHSLKSSSLKSSSSSSRSLASQPLVKNQTSSHQNPQMPFFNILWAPFASACFSISSVLGKKILFSSQALPFTALNFIIGGGLLWALLGLVFGLQAITSPFLIFSKDTFLEISWQSWIALGLLQILGQFFLYKAMKRAPLSVLLPFGNFRLIFSFFLAFFILKETPSGMSLFAMSLTILGLWLFQKFSPKAI